MDIITYFKNRNGINYNVIILVNITFNSSKFSTRFAFFFCSISISRLILNLFNIHLFDLFLYFICHLLFSCFSSFNIVIIIRGVFILGSPLYANCDARFLLFSSYCYYSIPIGKVYTYNRCSMVNSFFFFFFRSLLFSFSLYIQRAGRTKERQTIV